MVYKKKRQRQHRSQGYIFLFSVRSKANHNALNTAELECCWYFLFPSSMASREMRKRIDSAPIFPSVFHYFLFVFSHFSLLHTSIWKVYNTNGITSQNTRCRVSCAKAEETRRKGCVRVAKNSPLKKNDTKNINPTGAQQKVISKYVNFFHVPNNNNIPLSSVCCG